MKDPIQVVVDMFVSTDQRSWTEVQQCFYQEVEMDYSSMNGAPVTSLTPEQIVGNWKSILPGFTHTHHQLGNIKSTLHETRAEVFCYGTASHYLEDKGGSVWIVIGTYDFQLILDEGAWKIKSMKFNYKFQDGNVALPQKAMENLKD